VRARDYLDGAIRHAPGLGKGHGPLNHFWRAVY
jgi:hydroxymethylpyrimidine/phosphomethylpyrimidine kinase